MEPLLQTQRHLVPHPETPYSLHDQFSRDTSNSHDYQDEWRNRQEYSFPIRTSRSNIQAAVPSASALHRFPPFEHSLRRKTPNGTLDAGYDGSPAPFAADAPPLKHMVVPSRGRPGAPFPSYSFPQVSPPSTHFATVPGPPWGLNDTATAANFWPVHGSHTPNFQYVANYFPSVYQPPMRANDYNVRAFCPPPGPPVEVMPFGQGQWQSSHTVPQLGIFEPPSWNGAYGMAQPLVHAGGSFTLPNQHDNSLLVEYSEFANPLANCVSTRLNHEWGAVQDPGLGYQTRIPGHFGQSDFRKKALSQAYSVYVNLVAHYQASRKDNSSNGGTDGRTNSSKFLVFPKPPRPPKSFMYLQDATVYSSQPDNSNQLFSISSTGAMIPPDQNSFGNYVPPWSQSTYAANASQLMPSSIVPRNRSTQVIAAESSLNVLEYLCEQGDHSWPDGMLLAGCLHYVLGHFENARKLFSAVVIVDPSHVEAITNLAAALYCLERQDEAEKTWLRAVKLRPSYLEAVEHLVGLLYKKRCNQAIEVIEFVQKALRLDSQHSSCEDQKSISQSRQGFGSSGYDLPGTENGRMLALVHAKGTMLYGLKDVERASKAFEEAVLISVGRQMNGIEDVVHGIQAALSTSLITTTSHIDPATTPSPPLLPPEKALNTARLMFARERGSLPGLKFLEDGASKRAAVQTTSNSLLSLAKIFQDFMSNSTHDTNLLPQPPNVGDILALYYLSLSLQESPSTANNVGILLAGLQHVVPTTADSQYETFVRPNIPGIQPGSGLALALAYYHYGLRLDPKHVHLHTNLGSLLKDIGQLDLAIQMYERAVACDNTFDIALTNLANAVKDRGRVKDAIMFYKRAVKANPNFSEAICGLLTALNSVCDWRGRGGVVLENSKFDRWHVDDECRLVDARSERRGSGLAQRAVSVVSQQLGDASFWGISCIQGPFVSSLARELGEICHLSVGELTLRLKGWQGQLWEGSRLVRLIERSVRVAMHHAYKSLYVTKTSPQLTHQRPQLPQQLTVPSAPTVLPFHTFTTPLSAKDIRLISQRNAMRISTSTLRSPWLPSKVYMPPPPPQPHLNIGYVSSDFNNHPLAHLMQSVFGLHNTRRARAFCYATTAGDKSSHRLQIEREAPVFRDVSNWSADKIVQQITRDGIHILVNLNGYTRGARNEVFAARPTPIQMSFMGFAGSLGAEWCDYLLADTTAVPPGTLRPYRRNVSIEDIFSDDNEGDEPDWMYSENIIFCRDTFFCCDHKQSSDPSERYLTWEDEETRRWKMRKEIFPDLPDDRVILGNFNQLYKIEPTTFRTWLRILEKVPNAILWLLRFPEQGEINLRRTAEAWAGFEVAARIVFTDVAPKNQHIARARVCDLFLDTPECNAHTTAADVLWSSTPLLTLPRYPYKMCSRMAASILRGALPKSEDGHKAAAELIANDDTEYEQAAVRLASGLSYTFQPLDKYYGSGRGRLAELRRLLWDHKWSCGLFDTRRWVTDLEDAYEEAWRRWVAGEGGDIYL